MRARGGPASERVENPLRGRCSQVVAGAVTFGAMLMFGSSVAAHVGVDQDQIVAGESTALSFSFSHGCGESPTNSMKFQIPEGVDNAVPQVHAGWDIAVERADLVEPIESGHGAPVTDRPSVITFTARDGYEVPNGQRDTFTLSFRAPESAGQLFFPVIQGCVDGESAWIAQWDGTGAEPDDPAPSVMVVAGADTASTDTASHDDHGGDDTSDGGSNGLAIIGIVIGALGLGIGAVALTRTTR